MPAQRKALAEKEYDKIEQLRYKFNVPTYLNLHDAKGEVVVLTNSGTVSQILVNFYLESLFD